MKNERQRRATPPRGIPSLRGRRDFRARTRTAEIVSKREERPEQRHAMCFAPPRTGSKPSCWCAGVPRNHDARVADGEEVVRRVYYGVTRAVALIDKPPSASVHGHECLAPRW